MRRSTLLVWISDLPDQGLELNGGLVLRISAGWVSRSEGQRGSSTRRRGVGVGLAHVGSSGRRLAEGRMGVMSSRPPLNARDLADVSESVQGDLKWLRDTELATVDEAVLMDLSRRLRRLLVDGTHQRFRKAKGIDGEIRVASPSLPGTTPPPCWLAGGPHSLG